jgi:acetyl esterase
MKNPNLEPAAQAIADATSRPPYLPEMGVEGARQFLKDAQASVQVDLPPVDERWETVHAAVGDVRVRIVRPAGSTGPLPTFLYMHGGGWILGDFETHDRLVRELVTGVGAVAVFVEYTPSP